LFIGFSLPKLLYGCNHRPIGDWDIAFGCVNREFARIPGIPPLGDVRDAVLYRLDICANFPIGKSVPYYIQALTRAHYPRRKLHAYLPDGVVFRTKNGISTCFYNKHKECGHPDASGILRMEISMRRKRKIVEFLGNKYPSLRDLTLDRIVEVLKKDLEILRLDKPIVTDQSLIEALLSELYTPRQVRSLLGYLLERRSYTYGQLLARGYTRQTIHNYGKLLKVAGVSNLSLGNHIELPPLSMEIENVKLI